MRSREGAGVEGWSGWSGGGGGGGVWLIAGFEVFVRAAVGWVGFVELVFPDG